MRDWSPAALPAGRTPGVTITQAGPRLVRSAAISLGEATQPSRPAAAAIPARWSTWPSTELDTPSSRLSAPRSRLVSTVTARAIGLRTPSSFAAAAAPSAAAVIMARPPEAWTLNMRTPMRAASRAAPATVLGMSWNLRSRKTSAPRLWTLSIAEGPAAVKSWEPILKRVTWPWSRSRSRSASARLSTSRATIRRSFTSRDGSGGVMVLLERPHGDLALEQRLDAADRRLGSVHRGVVGDVLGHRGAPDQVGVLARPAVLRGVEDQGDLAPLHEVHDVRAIALVDLVDGLDRHALALQQLGGADGGDQAEAHLGQPLGDLQHRALVAVLDRYEHLAGGGQGRARRELRLHVGLAEVVVDAHDLAGRLHLGAEDGVHPRELDEGEDRLLHRDVPDLALLAEAESHQRVAEHHPGRELGQGHPDRLRHEGHRPGGARIDLEHEDLLVLDRELDVEQADDAELRRERSGLGLDALDLVVAQRVGRQRARGVARVHARLLHVLHDPAHHDPLPVRDGVHVDLEGVLEELVHQDGMLRAHPHRFLHVILEIRLVVHDLHGASAQHVGRPHQDRVADMGRDPRGFLEGARGGAGGLREPEPVEEIREAAAVLGAIDRVGRGAQDRHARALERHHQLERGSGRRTAR